MGQGDASGRSSTDVIVTADHPARHGRMTDAGLATSVPDARAARPMTAEGDQTDAERINLSNHQEPNPMYANFAAGTLIVLGVLIAVLGLFAAGEMVVVVTGLAAVLAGGVLGAVAARRPA